MVELKVTARSYPVVLVRCDGREAGLLKDKCFIVLLRVFLAVLAGIHVNHVKPGLVAVHRVEDNLESIHINKLNTRIDTRHSYSKGRSCI